MEPKGLLVARSWAKACISAARSPRTAPIPAPTAPPNSRPPAPPPGSVRAAPPPGAPPPRWRDFWRWALRENLSGVAIGRYPNRPGLGAKAIVLALAEA